MVPIVRIPITIVPILGFKSLVYINLDKKHNYAYYTVTKIILISTVNTLTFYQINIKKF